MAVCVLKKGCAFNELLTSSIIKPKMALRALEFAAN
jgi:hypothetical protein